MAAPPAYCHSESGKQPFSFSLDARSSFDTDAMNAETIQSAVRDHARTQRQTQNCHPAPNRIMGEGGEEYQGELCRGSEKWVKIWGAWAELPNRSKSNSSLPSNSTEDEERTELSRSCSSQHSRNKPPAFSLLFLPTHIRQQIYSYVLTDPSTTRTLVHISRAPRISPSYKVARPLPPRLQYHLDPIPREPFATALLLVSRELYYDVLPVLYTHKTFFPRDLEGLLPLFLNNLSPFARQNIRRIRLSEPTEPRASIFCDDRTKPTIHWAITCAQVATLNPTLHGVEVSGHSFLSEALNRPLLYPLCKIKAKKILVGRSYASSEQKAEADKRFEELLWEASERLKAAAKQRVESTQSEAADRARRREMEFARVRNIIALQEDYEKQFQADGDDLCCISKQKQSTGRDLTNIEGLKQFEAELEAHREKERIETEMNEEDEYEIVDLPPNPPKYEDVISEGWDVVSTMSGSTSPLRRCSTRDGEWQDTASTLAETISRPSIDKEKINETWGGVKK